MFNFFSKLFTFAQFSLHHNAIKISLCKLISCNHMQFSIWTAFQHHTGQGCSRYRGLSPKMLNSIPPLTPMVRVLWSFVSCQKTELHTRWVQSLAKKCSIVHQKSALSLDARVNHVAAQRLSFNCFSSLFGYLAHISRYLFILKGQVG